MNAEGFLVFNRHGIDRFTKTLPKGLSAGEYAVRLELSVPDGLFQQPIPTAKLTVPASAALAPPITVDLADMDGVCGVAVGIAINIDGNLQYQCPKCGFASWKKDFGPHYKPKPEPAKAKKAA